ncbi:MAG: 50S ribosomal protein L6 [Endomicrobium sp.]|jgi:large subunit ribosomal protein L6|nr:50S ribosomal protein L6 [Endomicrobium sp.]
MSRLGRKPVSILENVKVEFKDRVLEVIGPGGRLLQVMDNSVDVKISKGSLIVETLGNSREHRMLHGLMRGLIVNMIEGVTKGFKKQLEMIGLGYKANVEENGGSLVLSVGFSHLVTILIPNTVKVASALTPDKSTLITVAGISKYEVGAFAAKIRAVKPPEPYKGFGIRYLGERIIRKAGKTAASSGGK